MESIQFKGKENLSEVQALLNRNNVPNEFRVRRAFTRNDKLYQAVDVLNYEDTEGNWRVLTPGRWVGIDNGTVISSPVQP
jgi:hypothetical protein